jgi:hypothetical protein
MPEVSVSEFPEANWPLVIGVGILAAVVFYALYIANNLLNGDPNANQSPSSGVASGGIIGAITSITQGVASAFNNFLCSFSLGGNCNGSDQ